MICPACNTTVGPDMLMCPGCKGWITSGSTGPGVNASNVVSFGDVQAASLDRVCVGGGWDEAFGGGIIPGSSVLFTGQAGSGKSTLLIQQLSRLAALTGKKGFLLSSEQAGSEIKVALDRLQIPNPEMILGLREFGSGHEIDETLLEKYPPCAIVLDSLTASCGRDRDKAVVVGRTFKRLAVKYKCIVFLIAHMTKSGDLAGLETLVHDADVLASLDGPEPSGVNKDPSRFFQGNFKKLVLYKNRGGATFKPYWYEMTNRGLIEVPPDPAKEKRDAQEAGESEVRDLHTLAGLTLAIKQAEDELRDTVGGLRDHIKTLKAKQVAMAAAEPEKPRERKKKTQVDAPAPLGPFREGVNRPAPPKKAKPKAAPDRILMPDGQELVRRPKPTAARKTAAKRGADKAKPLSRAKAVEGEALKRKARRADAGP